MFLEMHWLRVYCYYKKNCWFLLSEHQTLCSARFELEVTEDCLTRGVHYWEGQTGSSAIRGTWRWSVNSSQSAEPEEDEGESGSVRWWAYIYKCGLYIWEGMSHEASECLSAAIWNEVWQQQTKQQRDFGGGISFICGESNSHCLSLSLRTHQRNQMVGPHTGFWFTSHLF